MQHLGPPLASWHLFPAPTSMPRGQLPDSSSCPVWGDSSPAPPLRLIAPLVSHHERLDLGQRNFDTALEGAWVARSVGIRALDCGFKPQGLNGVEG